MKRAFASAMLVVGLGMAVAIATASESQLWIADSPADHAKAETRGVVVAPDGSLMLGPRVSVSPSDSLGVIWALALLNDGSVALAGDRGRIDRWTESGGCRPWVKLPVGQVLSLANDGDGLVAGTGPNGLIYRIGARGDTALMCRTGERYVWGVVSAGKGAWYAATGTRGRLLRIENGRARVVLDTDESNLVCLIPDGKGGAFAGGDSKGRVVRVRADGSASTVFDASEDEVRALAIGADGALYAAALGSSAVDLDAAGGPDDDGDAPVRPAAGPAPVTAAVTGGRATIYRIVPDSSAASVWTVPQPMVYALARVTGALGPMAPAGGPGIVVATGNRAGVYALGRPGSAAQWLTLPQGQVTAFAADSRGRLLAATSNPGALWRVGPDRADRGTLTSGTLDARRYARFGRAAWRGSSSNVTLETRSGNSDPPDTTWSRWAVARDARSQSPPARYLQWRVTLAGGDPHVDAVELGYREQNLPPRVDEVVIAPQGIGFREGDLQPHTEPVTQTLPSGQRVEYSVTTQNAQQLRGLPAYARGLRTLQWKASDPNGDPLSYRVEVQRVGDTAWMEVGMDLDASSFTWDTNPLPDGRYRVRVTASDAGGNGVGEGLSGELLSEPFGVDNTAPRITRFDAQPAAGAIALSGAAEDDGSILVRLEVALDEDDWRTVSPEGGFADDLKLSFRARIDDVSAGAHHVAFRAVDLAGNVAVRSLQVTVPKSR